MIIPAYRFEIQAQRDYSNADYAKQVTRSVCLVDAQDERKVIDREPFSDFEGSTSLRTARDAAIAILRRTPYDYSKIQVDDVRFNLRFADVYPDTECETASGLHASSVTEGSYIIESGKVVVDCCYKRGPGSLVTQEAAGTMVFDRISSLSEAFEAGREKRTMKSMMVEYPEIHELVPDIMEATSGRNALEKEYTGRLRPEIADLFGLPADDGMSHGLMAVNVGTVHDFFDGFPVRSWGLKKMALLTLSSFRGFVVMEGEWDFVSETATVKAERARSLRKDSAGLPEWYMRPGQFSQGSRYITYWSPDRLDRNRIIEELNGVVYRSPKAAVAQSPEQSRATNSADRTAHGPEAKTQRGSVVSRQRIR